MRKLVQLVTVAAALLAASPAADAGCLILVPFC